MLSQQAPAPNPTRVNGNLAEFVSGRTMSPQIAGSKGNPNATSATNLGIRTQNVGRIPKIKERGRLQRTRIKRNPSQKGRNAHMSQRMTQIAMKNWTKHLQLMY